MTPPTAALALSDRDGRAAWRTTVELKAPQRSCGDELTGHADARGGGVVGQVPLDGSHITAGQWVGRI
jgi:hypothetical protein